MDGTGFAPHCESPRQRESPPPVVRHRTGFFREKEKILEKCHCNTWATMEAGAPLPFSCQAGAATSRSAVFLSPERGGADRKIMRGIGPCPSQVRTIPQKSVPCAPCDGRFYTSGLSAIFVEGASTTTAYWIRT